MKPSEIVFTDKFKDLLKSKKRIIHCEGVTGSGKSFQLGVKYFFKVFNSDKKQFVIAASTTSTVEKMIIDKPSSFYNVFNVVCHHYAQGVGGNRIVIDSPKGEKIIYLVGYDDKTRFKQILGTDVAGFLVEEIHVASDEFIREMFTRVYRNNGFLYTSSNGGMPDIIAYRDYLNKARPNDKWASEVPEPTMQELSSKEPDDDYEFWFYKFEDNKALTDEMVKKLYSAHPVGSFEYNSKILGIRGFVEGLIYARYLNYENNMVQFNDVYRNQQTKYPFSKYTIGVDVGSTDMTVFTLVGFTAGYREAIIIDKVEINHAGFNEIWDIFYKWFMPYHQVLSSRVYGVFIDSAAQILKTSLRQPLFNYFGLSIADSYKFTIKERVDWGIRLLHQGRIKFTEKAKETYDAFNNALYQKNLTATDIRMFTNHIYKDRIDSAEYAITPFIREMLQTL